MGVINPSKRDPYRKRCTARSLASGKSGWVGRLSRAKADCRTDPNHCPVNKGPGSACHCSFCAQSKSHIATLAQFDRLIALHCKAASVRRNARIRARKPGSDLHVAMPQRLEDGQECPSCSQCKNEKMMKAACGAFRQRRPGYDYLPPSQPHGQSRGSRVSPILQPGVIQGTTWRPWRR
jgi:hypothetical protein